MTATSRERLVLRAFHALRGSESTTLGGLRPVARATTQCWRGWTPRLPSVPCLHALRATAEQAPCGRTPSSCGRPTTKTAILRAVQAVSLCSTACPSSQIANSHRYPIFSWLRLQKNGAPCGLNLLSGLCSWSSADGVRGASPPFNCRALGRPLATRVASVERLPHPSPGARGAAAGRLAPAHKSVRRFPFRSRGSLQRRGFAPDAAGQLADARRWPSLPCRVRSSPPLRRSCCAGLRAVAAGVSLIHF